MTKRCTIRSRAAAASTLSVLLVVLAGAAPAAAQQAPRPMMSRGGGALPPIVTAAPPDDGRRINFNAGVNLVSQYIARGVAFVDVPSVQPYASVGIALPELQTGTLTQVKLTLGTWDSLQSGDPGLGQMNYGPWAGWYESDLYAALNLGFAGGWSGSMAVYYYHSPAHSFDDYGDLEAILRYDDTPHWKGVVPLRQFALKPQLRVTRSIGRAAGTNSTYVQPSLTPSFAIGTKAVPVRIGFPLAIGLSDRYYSGVNGGHVTFGYFRTGVTLAATLAKHDTTSWHLAGGIDVWFPNNEVANGLSSTEVVGRIGTSVNF